MSDLPKWLEEINAIIPSLECKTYNHDLLGVAGCPRCRVERLVAHIRELREALEKIRCAPVFNDGADVAYWCDTVMVAMDALSSQEPPEVK